MKAHASLFWNTLNRWCVALCILLGLSWILLPVSPAQAQNVINDLLSGKLNDPKVGQWVWYILKDKDGQVICSVRQAIVGEEKVGSKQGHWVEFEIVPNVGYKSVYKLLVVGPASDPRNVKRLIHKLGLDPIQEIEVTPDMLASSETGRAKRKSLGMDTVETGSGLIRGEHLEVTQGDRTIHLWVSPEIKPSGIIKLQTDEGEMVLRNYGVDGEYGRSALDESRNPEVQVKTSVDGTDPSAVPNVDEEPAETNRVLNGQTGEQ